MHASDTAAASDGSGLVQKQDWPLQADFSVAGRTALVTGASSGLGRHIARVLHAAGASVIALARREDRLCELCEELGDQATYMTCDVTDATAVQAAVERAIRWRSGLDIVVNDAGTATVAPAEEESLEDFRRQCETNVVGLFAVAQAAARSMLEQGHGSIINIASIYSAGGSIAPMAGYCASKGAVANLTRELAVQWSARGVRVNAIGPAYFPTPATEAVFTNPDLVDAIRARTPLGRAGRLDDLNGPVLFLASDASRYVTGHILYVDGGWTAI